MYEICAPMQYLIYIFMVLGWAALVQLLDFGVGVEVEREEGKRQLFYFNGRILIHVTYFASVILC